MKIYLVRIAGKPLALTAPNGYEALLLAIQAQRVEINTALREAAPKRRLTLSVREIR